MAMRPEDKSFWSGAVHGIWDGALRGFVIGGLIGVALILAAGAIGTVVAGGTLGALGVGLGSCITAFIAAGTIGAIVGAPLACVYEGVNEYIEEKEVQRDCKHAHELGFIEQYNLAKPPVDKKQKTEDAEHEAAFFEKTKAHAIQNDSLPDVEPHERIHPTHEHETTAQGNQQTDAALPPAATAAPEKTPLPAQPAPAPAPADTIPGESAPMPAQPTATAPATRNTPTPHTARIHMARQPIGSAVQRLNQSRANMGMEIGG